jgi:hypothetical protein
MQQRERERECSLWLRASPGMKERVCCSHKVRCASVFRVRVTYLVSLIGDGVLELSERVPAGGKAAKRRERTHDQHQVDRIAFTAFAREHRAASVLHCVPTTG